MSVRQKSHEHFLSIESSTIQPLKIMQVDLWGLAPILSSQSYQYYLSILDDFIRITWIFSLTTKSKALQTFKEFKTMIENNISRKIKCLLTDWGGKCRSFTIYLAE